MEHTANSIILLMLVGAVSAALTIPDSVTTGNRTLTHYSTRATWYQADRVCRANGGHLLLVDNQELADELLVFEETYGIRPHELFTRMVSHDDQQYYVNDTTCRAVNMSTWAWDTSGDAVWDEEDQCILVEGPGFKWRKGTCSKTYEYVCEYSEKCPYQETTISLASFPVDNANMAVCQDKCRQMIGCFATAPSGHATLPAFTHCLFIVTGDSTNPMAAMTCPLNYAFDDATNGADYPGNDPGMNPDDCLPTATNTSAEPVQWSLIQFLQELNASGTTSNQAVTIRPSPTVETAYVTVTAAVTAYVTLTPETVIETVMIAPGGKVEMVTVERTVINPSQTCSPFSSTVECPVCSSSTSFDSLDGSINKTKDEVLKEMEVVVKELTLEPRNMSRFKRTKESAPDERQSARVAGGWAVGIMAFIGLLVLLSDGTYIYRHVQLLKEAERKRQLQQR